MTLMAAVSPHMIRCRLLPPLVIRPGDPEAYLPPHLYEADFRVLERKEGKVVLAHGDDIFHCFEKHFELFETATAAEAEAMEKPEDLITLCEVVLSFLSGPPLYRRTETGDHIPLDEVSADLAARIRQALASRRSD